MNGLKKNSTLAVLVLTTLLFVGCSKKGCTDQSADNFDNKAKKSDNSCTYTGDVVFWYGRETSEALVASGATSLIYYFDNQLVGSTSSNVYVIGAINCDMDGTITVNKKLGGNKGGAFSYRIEDQLGLKRFEGIINLEGGKCIKKELAF